MNSREYWAKRSQVREAKAYSNCLETTRGLVSAYRQTAANIRREINDFYVRFARENKLEYSDAVRYLTNSETLEWKASVEDYIKEISREKDPAVRERLMREYDARAYGARITRLESLNGSIDNELSKLYARANSQFRELLGENYTDGYYRTIFDIQNRFGYSSMFATVSAEVVENAISYPWSGANFSDRLWKHKFELQNQLRETLTTGFIRGDSIQTMAKRLAERLDVSRSNATRLIITESSHIHNSAEFNAYKECGFDEYEFMASLGERTCEVCGGMDGKRIKLADKQFGVNFPPLHPNCRCTTIAFDPDDDIEGFKDRLENGELSYDKWYEKYVKGRVQPKIESKQSEDFTANTPNPQPIIPENDGISAYKSLTNKENGDIIQSKRKPFQELNFSCRTNKQQEHIFGTKHWKKVSADSVEKGNNPKSYFYPDVDIETLVRGYMDENKLKYTSRSEYPRFYFTAETPIGKTFDRSINSWIDTKRVMVVFSSKGWHAVPVIDKR